MTSISDTEVVNAPGGLVELGFVQRTTEIDSTATSVASASNIFSSNLTFVSDGSPVIVEFSAPVIRILDSNGTGVVALVDGSGNHLCYICTLTGTITGVDIEVPASGRFRYTPPV